MYTCYMKNVMFWISFVSAVTHFAAYRGMGVSFFVDRNFRTFFCNLYIYEHYLVWSSMVCQIQL